MLFLHPLDSFISPPIQALGPSKHEPARGLVHNLPTEMLMEIFIRCPPHDVLRYYDTPVILSQVCVRWRHIALSMPILWASFSATPPRNPTKKYLDLVGLWLKNSRHCPLTFTFAIDMEDHKRQIWMEKSFPLFLSQINRWHTVDLVLNKNICQQFLSAPPGSESPLYSLNVDARESTTEQVSRLLTAINKFTKLHQLEFFRLKYTPLIGVRWSRLTHIRLDTPLPMDECIEILTECLYVVDCALLQITEPHDPITPSDILLSRLITLCLHSACDIGAILSCLTCPEIRELVIRQETVSDRRDILSFMVFLSRSSWRLEKFCLWDDHLPECDLINFITAPALQSVKILDLWGSPVHEKTVTLFMIPNYDDGSDIIMPCMKTLLLRVEQVPDNLLSDMIVSRFRLTPKMRSSGKITPLRDVKVWFSWTLLENYQYISETINAHSGDLKKFKGFLEAGLNIDWRL